MTDFASLPAPGAATADDFRSVVLGTPDATATASVGAPNDSQIDAVFPHMLGQESGGRQLNKDGTPVTSRKGAIGIAQVMPGTAPEAAALAGVSYDEQRYRTDADYNKALGRAYLAKQVNDFGSIDKGLAAYNAGPDAMSRALARATKAGTPDAWLQFLPAETQAYVPAILHKAGPSMQSAQPGQPTSAGAIGTADSYYQQPTETPYATHEEPPPGAGTLDYFKEIAASAMDAVGSMAQAGGEGVAALANEFTGTHSYVGKNLLKEPAESLRDTMTAGGKAAVADSQAQGDFFRAALTGDTSGVKLPTSSSGYGMLAASLLGMMAPTLIPVFGQAGKAAQLAEKASALNKAIQVADWAGAAKLAGVADQAAITAKAAELTQEANSAATVVKATGAATQGAMVGGGGAEAVRQSSAAALSTMSHDQLMTIPTYAEAFNQTGDDGQAKQATVNSAALLAGGISALAGAGAGAFNAKVLHDSLIHAGMSKVIGNSATSTLGRAAIGATGGAVAGAAEGTAMQVGQNAGENIGLGQDVTQNVTRDTMGQVVGGAMLGAGGGIVAGAKSHPEPVAVVAPGLEHVAATAAEPNSPMSKAAMASAEAAAADPARIAAEAQAREQAAADVAPKTDPLAERAAQLADAIRQNGALDALRAEGSPVGVQAVMKDLAVAQSSSTPASAREQALGRLEYALEWAGVKVPERGVPAAEPTAAPAPEQPFTPTITPKKATLTPELSAAATLLNSIERSGKPADANRVNDVAEALGIAVDPAAKTQDIVARIRQAFDDATRDPEPAAQSYDTSDADQQRALVEQQLAESNNHAADRVPGAPSADSVIAALSVAAPLRSAEQTAIVRQARERYSQQDGELLKKAATYPAGMSAAEKIRLESLRRGEDRAEANQAADQTSDTKQAVEKATAESDRIIHRPPEVTAAAELLAAIDRGGVPLNPARLNETARNLGLDVSTSARPEDTIARLRAAVDRATPKEGSDASKATTVAVKAPRVAIPAGDGSAAVRKRRATIAQLIEMGLTQVERRADGFYLTDGKREFKLEGPADAQLARTEIQRWADDKAGRADTEASREQKLANNAKKGDVIKAYPGIDFIAENPAGSVRTDLHNKPPKWESQMHDHYGDIAGTVGADGDKVDAFWSGRGNRIFVIDQVDPKTGKFDEHKVILRARDEADARNTYLRNYEKGWQGLGSITEMKPDEFRTWVHDKKATQEPLGDLKDGAAGQANERAGGERAEGRNPDAAAGVDDRGAGRVGQDGGVRDDAAGLPDSGVIAPGDAPDAGSRPDVTVQVKGKKVKLKLVKNEDLGKESLRRGARGKQLTAEQGQMLQRLARLLGKEVIFFEDRGNEIGDGFVNPGNTKNIFVNSHTGIHPMAVVGHELWHLIRSEMPETWDSVARVVQAHLKDDAPHQFRNDYHKANEGPNSNHPLGDRDIEELTSDIGGNLIADPKFWREVFDQVDQDHGERAKGLIAAIADFFYGLVDRIVKGLSGRQTFRATDFITEMKDVRAAFRDGLAKYIAANGITRTAMQAEILRAGVEHARKAEEDAKESPAREARDHTDTPEFKAWFGDSVITKNGKAGGDPLVVYHGTATKKVIFERDGSAAGSGIYFTPNKETAKSYAEDDAAIDGDRPIVMPVYLSLKNPFRSSDHWEFQSLSRERRDELEAKGFDGVVGTYRNGDVEYVAFSPEQIKSAGRNDGSFDPNSPDITRSPKRDEKSDNASDEQRSGAEPSTARTSNGETPVYGTARPGSVSAVGVHFSKQPRTRLDSIHYGTGAKGLEAERLSGSANDDIRPRTFFYVDKGNGVQPEDGVGGNAHRVQLNNLYDVQKDPLGIVKDNPGPNNWERAVARAGFDGYLNDDPKMPQAYAVLVGKHENVPVERFTPPGFSAPVEQPTSVKKALTSREINDVDVSKIPGATLKSGTLTVPIGEREAANAEMERIGSDARFSPDRDLVESPGFEKWFDKSKVTDDRGEPMVVYHGTQADFNAFDASKIGSSSSHATSNLGFYFSTDPRVAEIFGRDFHLNDGTVEDLHQVQNAISENQHTMPVYLAIKKPYSMSAETFGHIVETYTPKQIRTVRSQIESLGHDGILIRRAEPYINSETVGDTWVAFKPEQIKSAMGNSGEFDATNADITRSPARDQALETAKPVLRYLKPEERAKLRRDTAAKLVDTFSKLPSANEMAAVAFAGKAKRGWYDGSAKALEHVFGHDAPRFAALLAAMSPQTSVETNLRNALNTWKNWVAAGRPVARGAIVEIMGRSVEGNKLTDSVLPAWIPNSVRALETQDPSTLVISGPKVNSFMLNLRGVADEVTNDAWMANYAAVDQRIFSGNINIDGTDPGKTPGYLAMSARVRQAAAALTKYTGDKWSPAEVQETIWSWAKTLYELQDKDMGARELLDNKAVTDELIASTPDFSSQLHEERNDDTLRQAGYGEQLDSLHSGAGAAAARDEESGARSQAGPFDPETQDRHERRAASRLEQLRDDRLAAERQRADEVAGEDARQSPARLEDFDGDTVKDLLHKDDWAILTAENPNASRVSDEANNRAMTKLRTELVSDGLQFKPVEGKYDHKENALAVVGIDDSKALALGQKYGQESVLTNKGLLYRDGSVTPATDIETFDKAPDNYYSKVGDTYFRVNLNWDAKTEPASLAEIRASKARDDGSERKPWFHSDLEHAIESIPERLSTMSAPQWKLWLDANAGKYGVKKDEIEWSGLPEFLKLRGKDKITRDELAEFVRENGVQVKEVVLDSTRPRIEFHTVAEAREYLMNFHDQNRADFDEDYAGWTSHDIIHSANELLGDVAPDAVESTKFQQYTLPGGSNYREVLLTLPTASDKNRSEYERRRAAHDAARESGEITKDEAFNRMEADKKELGIDVHGRDERAYQSSHWDQPNVLAHLRVDDRTDADGKKVLFLNEIQSDWGQDGKKHGFGDARFTLKAAPVENADVPSSANSAGRFIVFKPDGSYLTSFSNEEDAVRHVEYGNRNGMEGFDPASLKTGVPRGPFVGKTEAWVSLALKRAITMAIENGQDKVAWVNGEQAADFFDLSKQIKSIVYDKVGDTWDIEAEDLNGNTVIHEEEVGIDRIESLVGKDVATKISNLEGERITPDNPKRDWHRLSGLDLKVGGEGMRAFYDKIVPQVANDVLKKIGGGKVGDATIAGKKFGTYNRDGDLIREYASEDAAEEAHSLGEGVSTGSDKRELTQPGFDITPSMREKLKDGAPLFSPARDSSEDAVEAKSRIDDDSIAPADKRATGAAVDDVVHSPIRDLAVGNGYKVSDLLDSSKKVSWWDKSVGTPYHLAEKHPPFKKVYDAIQDFIGGVNNYATRAHDLAPNILPKLEDMKDIFKSPLSAKDVKDLAGPIFQGTLSYARDAEHNPVRTNDVGLAGVVWTDDELRSMWKLDDRQIGLYREFRKTTNKSVADMGVTHMVKLAGADGEGVRERVLAAPTVKAASEILADHLGELAAKDPDRADLLQNTARTVKEIADTARGLMAKGYAPLSRFGEYTVYVTRGDEQVYFGMYESQREANRATRAFKEDPQYADANVKTGTMSQDEFKLFKGVTPETLALFGEALGLHEGATDRESQVFQTMLQLAKTNRSAMKHMIERKGVAGYSEDVGRVLAQFIYSNARQASTNLHAGEISKRASEVPDGDLKDQAIRLMDYVNNPAQEAQALRGMLFSQYIGGSLASAAVNLTQSLTTTWPALSMHFGIGKSARFMADALGIVKNGAGADKELGEAMARAAKEGITAPQETHQLLAHAQGRGSLQSGDGTQLGNTLAKLGNSVAKIGLVWGKAFGFAEVMNRQIAFAAAFKLAREKGMDNPYEFAKKIVGETQFTMNKGNNPVFSRGPVGATLFTFKKFTINYLEGLQRMWGSGPEGKKAFALSLGIIFMMAGVGGFPFVGNIDDVIDGFAQRVLNKSFNSKQARLEFFTKLIGDAGAQFVTGGISSLPGVPIDFSGRMGLGTIVPGTGLLTKKQDYTNDVLQIGGAAASMAQRVFQGGAALASGDVSQAVQHVVPVAISNVLKAKDMIDMGEYRDAKGRKVIDTTVPEAILKGIGFQPSSVANLQQAGQIQQSLIAQNRIRTQEISDLWAQGRIERDPAKVADAQRQLMEWNRDNPSSPIQIQTTAINSRVREANMSKAQRLEKASPKGIRSSVKAALEAAQQ